ncbi:MAG TPA: hypothetical protein VHV30_03700 [Polyangiaceae bacterium]|nr:hypothetical protein [Polyangiaceae bacterium]
MSARSSPRGAVLAALALAALGVVALACGIRFPEGYACGSSDQCEDGLACLYPAGSGCDAQPTCTVPSNDCGGSTASLVLCACGTSMLDLTCVPSNLQLAQPTATGPACAVEGGIADGGTAGGPDASGETGAD